MIDQAAQQLAASIGASINRARGQLETILANVSNFGPTEYQYALLANTDGPYPDVRNGMTWLNVGDVWKYGTSLDPNSRYSQAYLNRMNLDMVSQTSGTASQVLIQEKIKLIGYVISNGSLPPGNEISK